MIICLKKYKLNFPSLGSAKVTVDLFARLLSCILQIRSVSPAPSPLPLKLRIPLSSGPLITGQLVEEPA